MSLERYISDKSIELFGLADRSIVDYVLASGKSLSTTLSPTNTSTPAASSSKTPAALFAALNASGLPDTPDAHAFTNEVFSRAPRKHKHKHSSTDSARRQADKDAKSL
ncbi:hypothetical protein V5O48_019130, partial [Marasmius crinis-equi]